MRPRTLGILLGVVLALGLFIFLYERKLPSTAERAEQAKKLVPVKKEEILALTLESTQGTVSLERLEQALAPESDDRKAKQGEGGEKPDEAATVAAEWRLTRPLKARADSFAVDRFLDTLTAVEKTRTLTDVDAKSIGLEPARATVRLKTKEGERVLLFGVEVPTGGALIAGFRGAKEAFVVADSILTDISKPAGDWRDRQLFHGGKDAIQRITLRQGGAPPVVLVQRATGFVVEQPLVDRADRDQVEALITDLTGLSAERFVENPALPELGLAPAQATIEVALRGAKPLTIELGSAVQGEAPKASGSEGGSGQAEPVYVRVDDAVVEARTRLAEAAKRTPDAWRSRSLAGLEVHQVERATVLEGGAPLELSRADTDWKRGATIISYLPVSDLLFALSNTRAERLLAPAEAQAMGAGTAKPLLTFKLKSKDAGDETITLYPALPQGVPARVSGRAAILLLPADALKQVQEKLAEVRKAKPVTPEKPEKGS
jgi:hypothetical protein